MHDPADALRKHWRKVSSTDNLQAFAEEHAHHAQASTRAHSRIMGLCMMLFAAALLVGELTVLAAKLIQRPSSRMMQTLHMDSYYVYLAPLMLPVVIIGVTANWFSLKVFKHNS